MLITLQSMVQYNAHKLCVRTTRQIKVGIICFLFVCLFFFFENFGTKSLSFISTYSVIIQRRMLKSPKKKAYWFIFDNGYLRVFPLISYPVPKYLKSLKVKSLLGLYFSRTNKKAYKHRFVFEISILSKAHFHLFRVNPVKAS